MTSITAESIRDLYESNANRNAFTDALKLKLETISTDGLDFTEAEKLKLATLSTDGLDFTEAEKLKLAALEADYIGDVKSCFQTNDHGGWVRLDGRPISTLTPTQQGLSLILGFPVTLPDATNSYLVQGNNLGQTLGSNNINITQPNLPDIALTGTTNTTGSHNHSVTGADNQTNKVSPNSGGVVRADQATRTTSSNGNHSHTVTIPSLNGGVPQTALDNRPLSIQVNYFIYFGL